MKEILLDGAAWQSAEDFYTAFLPTVGAPDWHGHNLDALWDSLGAGGINQVNPPLRVMIRGGARMGTDAKNFVARFQKLVEDLRKDGIDVELHLES